MKKRIGSKGTSAGLAAVLMAGAMMSCTGGTAGTTAVRADTGGVTLTQTAEWIDRENRRGAVNVEVMGLENLRMAQYREPGELQEDQEDDVAGTAVTDGFAEAEGLQGSGMEALEAEESRSEEDLGENAGFSDGESAEKESEALESANPVFVMYLSEYFLLDESEYAVMEGFTTEEIPIVTKMGQETTITRISCPIWAEESWQFSIPVMLRREYGYPIEPSVFPVSQDAPLKKSREEEEFCAAGTFVMAEGAESPEILADTESASLELEAARADFSVSLEALQEETKAGQRLYFQLTMENTGEIALEDIRLSAEFSPLELETLWETEQNMEIGDDGAVVTRLARGETKRLTFSVKPEEDQSGAAAATVTASAAYPGKGEGENSGEEKLLVREAALPLVIAPLRADFTVDKTADCEEAGPGDTITYQICIRNTGERTLHSVISTERFLYSNIKAQFEEMEGIELNGTKTQARIARIAPGDCVNLKARVTLPENIKDQNLINQVIVVTDETGESQAVRSQAEVKVKAEPEKTPPEAPSGEGGAPNTYQTSRTSPKTGDRSQKELFEVLILCSFLASAAAAIRLIAARQRDEKGKRKR